MKKVILSAGHGAGDPGVVYKNLKESDLTTAITNRAVEMIKKHGVTCLAVPANLSLQQTINWINNNNPNETNICVEVHINSGGGHGTEAWNYVGGPNESDRLSQFLADAVSAETGLPSRGIKDESTSRFGKLGFVHDTVPIAALIEIAFIDGDYDFLLRDENLTRAAKGVARGCLSYLGVAWKPEIIGFPPATNPLPAPIITEDTILPQIENRSIRDIKNELLELRGMAKDLRIKVENAKRVLS